MQEVEGRNGRRREGNNTHICLSDIGDRKHGDDRSAKCALRCTFIVCALGCDKVDQVAARQSWNQAELNVDVECGKCECQMQISVIIYQLCKWKLLVVQV